MANSIQFVQPDNALQNYVQHYYMADLSGSPEKEGFEQKTLSTGCVEMFIGYQNTCGTCFTGSGNTVQTELAIVGAHNLKNNIQVMMGSANDSLKFISINFKPKGFYNIFKIAASEIYNGVFASNEVLGNEIKYLQEQLDNSRNNNDRKHCLDSFLIKQLNKNSDRRYNIKAGFEIADYIEFHKGNIRTNQIIQEFKISDRSLQRSFKLALGLPFKEYCKITRFQNLIDFINTRSNINWADMVFQFGYYDQSHMISEFKNATDITPSLFMKHKNNNIFKIGNHLAILKNIDNSLIQEVIDKSEEYTQVC
jgi:AraC-like DNA-binding protein